MPRSKPLTRLPRKPLLETRFSYSRELMTSGVYVRRSGASGQPIIYQAEGTVVCRGFTVQASYIHIVGFEITDTVNNWEDGDGVHSAGKYNEIRSNYIHDVTRIGIQIFSPSPDSPEGSNCVVRGNRIVRAGLAGIEIYGQNHLVESNEISHTLQYPVKWTNPPDWADADGLHFFGSGHIIRKNFIHDITLNDPENIASAHRLLSDLRTRLQHRLRAEFL